jgi:FkbM family methyltransferase
MQRRARLVVAGLGVLAAALISLLALPHGFLLGPRHHRIRTIAPSEDELIAQWGPALYSQGYEELIVRDFFDDAWRGTFVDVGAGHYRDDSTTYFLEHHRSWHGIAVDANLEYAADYGRFRPRTRFVNAFVSDREGGLADFAIAVNPVFSSGVRPLPADAVVRHVKVPTTTLEHILVAEHMGRIDFLSIDVEGAELQVLEGFDLRRHRPRLICIEIDPAARDRIFEHLHAAGYRELDAYHPLNEWNAWFTPTED